MFYLQLIKIPVIVKWSFSLCFWRPLCELLCEPLHHHDQFFCSLTAATPRMMRPLPELCTAVTPIANPLTWMVL